jgi:TonB family protein
LSCLLATGPAGCKTSAGARADFPRSGYSADFGDAPPGSIADLSRKQGQAPAAASARERAAAGEGDLVLLVMHDAEGRPVYVETRRSSGDPALDRRAQDYVLRHRRFPKGAANTVLLPLKRGEVPKHVPPPGTR